MMTTASGNVYLAYDNDKYCEMILPTELASGLINNDWSILDYVDDAEYSKCVNQLMQQLEYDGLDCVDVINDDSFTSMHDMVEYGVLATNCSSFVFKRG
tara:strand:+ start:135 stop:431 length:297 start_codon:yes stop_codon:yes gene_type:complete